MNKAVACLLLLLSVMLAGAQNARYIDPAIGSEGLGRVYVGPTMPFGMIRPSAVAESMPNSGWAPMPASLRGFAQVHVSGTGGGQKYGNILIMPFTGNVADQKPLTMVSGEGWNIPRIREAVELGRYSCSLASGIDVDITSAERSAIYHFTYPEGEMPGLAIDAGFFLGYSPVPDQRETQQLVGSQIQVLSDYEIQGYNRVRGGWNNGRAYTVYFYAVSDLPISSYLTWKGDPYSPTSDEVTSASNQTDSGGLTGALLNFPLPEKGHSNKLTLKIGISFISELKARENLLAQVGDKDFDRVHKDAVEAWDSIVSRISLDESTPEDIKRMFYTAIYHTLLMPTDRTGENPLWNDKSPYYDDFYAIWDTYRTSSPLITLLDPTRQTDIVRSLVSIWKREGFLPDARSGNSNGRTQGGSNAEIVIADAFAKDLAGIDYEQALEAMLTDAEVAPAGRGEAEGRGGLKEYNTLGYVPFGIDRAGNRTVEYSLCDYAIAQLAKGLGKANLADKYMLRAANWRNLWRYDCEHAGAKGFIMPRDANGEWLDSLSYGHSALLRPKYAYTPLTWEGPWYTPWWGMFMYESPSWEYSLSVPHDVPALIEACGGAEAFERRLDTLFDNGYYNVNNEPSFFTPCLYHWIGKPWRSAERIRQIVKANFNDGPQGLPGNDDSGAMSSWLAFHILGIYPNTPSDYYLINVPMVKGWKISLPDGKEFAVEVENFSPDRTRVQSITFSSPNKERLLCSDSDVRVLTHSQILDGGVMKICLDSTECMLPEMLPAHASRYQPALTKGEGDFLFTFKLHGQTRRYEVKFIEQADSLMMLWGIERNLQWQSGAMIMSKESILNASILNSSMPIDGERLSLPSSESAYILSQRAFSQLLADGATMINADTLRLLDKNDGLLHAVGTAEGAEIWVKNDPSLPVVMRMAGNPLEIDWSVTPLR